MLDHRKTAAFLAALLIGASAALMPAGSALADNEPASASEASTAAEAADSEEVSTAGTTADSGRKTSGSFTYTLTDEGTACIQDCSSEDKDLVIPAEIDGITVTELGKKAFGDTPDQIYETISIPASIEYISADGPFVFCEQLREITVDENNEHYVSVDGVLYTKDKKDLLCYPRKKEGSSFTVPSGVENILFGGIYMTDLKEIKLPSSLKSVKQYSFGSNQKLKSIDMSGTQITDISSFAFVDCSALTEVKFPNCLETIEGAAFWMCKSLAEITLPSGLLYIGQMSFMDTALKEAAIPSSVQEISYCAFGYTSDGDEQTPIDDFVIIGAYGSAAYNYCTDSSAEENYKNNFTFRTFEEDAAVKEILALDRDTEDGYEYAKIDGKAYILTCTASSKTVTVPSTLGGLPVEGAYPSAFSSCSAEEIVISEGMTSLRELAFYGCPYIKKLTLPQSMQSIGDNCFDSCGNLEELDCGGAVTFGEEAFANCVSLRSVTISGNCSELGKSAPFLTCSALEEINVTKGDGAYSSKKGVLFDNSGEVLIEYPVSRPDKVYKIPSGTKEIREFAFGDCKFLEDAVIPKSVTKLGDYAFYGCTSLKKLRAYKELKDIGTDAFGMMANAYYDSSDTSSNEAQSISIEGFKLYTSKNTAAYDYAKEHDLKIVTGTVRLGNKNINVFILGVMGVLLIVGIVMFTVASSQKHIRKKPAAGKKDSSGSRKGNKQ